MRFLKYLLLFTTFIFVFFFSSLTKQVFAGCSGVVQCGSMAWRCSGNMATCTGSDDARSCIGHGTCEWLCDINLSTNSCSGFTNKASCEGVRVSDCTTHCNTSIEQQCTWSSGGGATPTPTPTPTSAVTPTPHSHLLDQSCGKKYKSCERSRNRNL